MEIHVPFTQYAQSTPLFTVKEARDLYRKDAHSRSILNLLHRLKLQGRVRLVANGVYSGALAAHRSTAVACRVPSGTTLSSRSTRPLNYTVSLTKFFKRSTTFQRERAKMSSSAKSRIIGSLLLKPS